MDYSYDFERSFDFLWKTVVVPILEIAYNDLDENFREITGIKEAFKSRDDYKDTVKKFYKEKRDWLKCVYLPHENHPILDTHKIGALWCRSLLAYKAFYFDEKKAEAFIMCKYENREVAEENDEDRSAWFAKNVYVNYRVAFLVSVGVLYISLLSDCKDGNIKYDRKRIDDSVKRDKEPAPQIFDYFRNRTKLRAPLNNPGHDDFETSCIIALQKNDILMRDFDYLAYAIILFQLEHYNKMCYYMELHNVPIDVV